MCCLYIIVEGEEMNNETRTLIRRCAIRIVRIHADNDNLNHRIGNPRRLDKPRHDRIVFRQIPNIYTFQHARWYFSRMEVKPRDDSEKPRTTATSRPE